MPIVSHKVYKDEAGRWRWVAFDEKGKDNNSSVSYFSQGEAEEALRKYLFNRKRFQKRG